jgi:hypothetical protein
MTQVRESLSPASRWESGASDGTRGLLAMGVRSTGGVGQAEPVDGRRVGQSLAILIQEQRPSVRPAQQVPPERQSGLHRRQVSADDRQPPLLTSLAIAHAECPFTGVDSGSMLFATQPVPSARLGPYLVKWQTRTNSGIGR